MVTQAAFATPLGVHGNATRVVGVSTTTARPRFSTCRFPRSAARGVVVCTATPADAPSAAEADPELIETSFSRLKHPNPTQRQAASSRLAALGTPEIIARLVGLLSETDTSYRRAAVQALGMCGEPAVAAVVSELRATTNATVRASCAKALAATGLYHPEMRAAFPRDALDSLRDAMQGADPVTKLASVGCLGTLGSDAGEGMPGSQMAYETLAAMLEDGLDVAIGAVAVGAVAQIAQNGNEERKADVLQRLKRLADGNEVSDAESGLGYVREMAKSHVEQLEGKGAARA